MATPLVDRADSDLCGVALRWMPRAYLSVAWVAVFGLAAQQIGDSMVMVIGVTSMLVWAARHRITALAG